MTLDQSFGEGNLTRQDVVWPGDADAGVAWIEDLASRWRTAVGATIPAELLSSERARWPFASRPFADVVAWVNIELARNAAEIGYARFLYAVQ